MVLGCALRQVGGMTFAGARLLKAPRVSMGLLKDIDDEPDQPGNQIMETDEIAVTKKELSLYSIPLDSM